ncbi:MAG: MarR family transcriptional regulator [Naasia sp.]
MATTDPGLAGALLEVLRALTRHGAARAMQGRDGLSTTEAWVLDYLSRYDRTRVSAVAAWQGVDRSTMSVQLARLERRGFICRTPDPDDGRAVLVALTDEGRRRSEDQREAATRFVAEAVGSWNMSDRALLTDLLIRLTGDLSVLRDEDSEGRAGPGDDEERAADIRPRSSQPFEEA